MLSRSEAQHYYEDKGPEKQTRQTSCDIFRDLPRKEEPPLRRETGAVKEEACSVLMISIDSDGFDIPRAKLVAKRSCPTATDIVQHRRANHHAEAGWVQIGEVPHNPQAVNAEPSIRIPKSAAKHRENRFPEA